MYYFFRKIFLHFSGDKVDKNFRKGISHQTDIFNVILVHHALEYCYNVIALIKYSSVLTKKAFNKLWYFLFQFLFLKFPGSNPTRRSVGLWYTTC